MKNGEYTKQIYEGVNEGQWGVTLDGALHLGYTLCKEGCIARLCRRKSTCIKFSLRQNNFVGACIIKGTIHQNSGAQEHVISK